MRRLCCANRSNTLTHLQGGRWEAKRIAGTREEKTLCRRLFPRAGSVEARCVGQVSGVFVSLAGRLASHAATSGHT